MDATRIMTIWIAVLYVLFWAAVFCGIVYLFILIIKVLKKYINSKEVRNEKKVVAKSLGEALKENRLRCQMTQEFVAETLGVSRYMGFLPKIFSNAWRLLRPMAYRTSKEKRNSKAVSC